MLNIKLMREAGQLSRCAQMQRKIQEALGGSKDSEQVEKKEKKRRKKKHLFHAVRLHIRMNRDKS